MDETRIEKIRNYLFGIINTLTEDRNYQINANMLSDKIDDYSLDKIPTAPVVSPWILGGGRYKETYSFKTRKSYSKEAIVNLDTMGFFEKFEKTIEENNKNKIRPEITGIEKIELLNPFTMSMNDDGKSAKFEIQIEITYHK